LLYKLIDTARALSLAARRQVPGGSQRRSAAHTHQR